MRIKELAKLITPIILARDNKPQISTGIKTLDEKMWGFRKPEVVIVAGRPSQGKSALSLYLAFAIAGQDKKVGFFSLEMSKEEIAERGMATISGIENKLIQRGQMSDAEKERMNMFIEAMPDLDLHILDDTGFKWDDMETYILAEKPDVLIVDFVQMISQKPNQQEREAYSEYIRKAKQFVKKYHLVIIINSQINRKPEENVKIPSIPRMSELKGSGSLEEGADKILIVHWYWKFGQVDESKNAVTQNDYAIYIAKNRNGGTGIVRVLFYPETYSYKDVYNTEAV